MGHSKISVTIPDEMYKEIKEIASKNNMKLSHLVTKALSEKTQKMKDEELIQQINEVFKDPDVSREQRAMANMIADNTDLEELPW